MSSHRISPQLRRRLLHDARFRCGYCLTSLQIVGFALEVDHIIPEGAGGESSEENLWIACASCNRHKGSRTHANDPLTGHSSALFNPRQQTWSDHFQWSEEGTRIMGITPCGRATTHALNMNNPEVVAARSRWVRAGWHPPEDSALPEIGVRQNDDVGPKKSPGALLRH
ncbi:MAG: HNH endonuclease [Armatimonadetes bacterium]|nr:HNH endonuclease [Armatimonadota bacterium]